MKTALFTNFSNEIFIGYWDGKPKTFKPGESKYLPEYLAKHFAKHLVNREILKLPNGETMTSPKFPEQVPQFMELFNKACITEEDEEETSLDVEVDVINKNHEATNFITNKEPQIVEVPEEDDDTEESFKGAPIEE